MTLSGLIRTKIRTACLSALSAYHLPAHQDYARMTTSHADFFASVSQTRAENLQGEHAAVLNARGIMGLLYRQAALMVVAAQAQGVGVVLKEWTTCDRFEVKVGFQEVWISRERDAVEITFRNFSQALVPHSTFALKPDPGEKPDAFAARTMAAVRAAFWPDAARAS